MLKTLLIMAIVPLTQILHADPLLLAIEQVESGGDPRAIGDGGRALGLLQIHAVVVQDVNRRYGLKLRHRDMHDQSFARLVYYRYMAMWATEERLGRPVTDEDRARVWNGGPNGWRHDATLGYWRKVEAVMRGGVK